MSEFKRSQDFKNISRFGMGQTLAGTGIGVLVEMYAPVIFPNWSASGPLALTIAAMILIVGGLIYGSLGMSRAEATYRAALSGASK